MKSFQQTHYKFHESEIKHGQRLGNFRHTRMLGRAILANTTETTTKIFQHTWEHAVDSDSRSSVSSGTSCPVVYRQSACALLAPFVPHKAETAQKFQESPKSTNVQIAWHAL